MKNLDEKKFNETLRFSHIEESRKQITIRTLIQFSDFFHLKQNISSNNSTVLSSLKQKTSYTAIFVKNY